jgi:anti-sigma B factor antagonist
MNDCIKDFVIFADSDSSGGENQPRDGCFTRAEITSEPGIFFHPIHQEGRMSKITKSNSQVVVQPEMNLESSTSDTFRETLLSAVNRNHSDLVIDLAKVDTIDSVGLGVFIATYNTLAKKEKKLKVINASRRIHSLFQTMGLTRRFKVDEKVDEAVREVQHLNTEK